MSKLQEGTKYDNDKVRLDLMPIQALMEVGRVMTFGATKYEDNNWRKGMRWGRLIAASLRHIFAWLRGETYDPETKINHLAHACVNLLFILEYTATGTGIDDRYTYPKKEEG